MNKKATAKPEYGWNSQGKRILRVKNQNYVDRFNQFKKDLDQNGRLNKCKKLDLQPMELIVKNILIERLNGYGKRYLKCEPSYAKK